MAIGKNKRLTKRVAASGADSEDCSRGAERQSELRGGAQR